MLVICSPLLLLRGSSSPCSLIKNKNFGNWVLLNKILKWLTWIWHIFYLSRHPFNYFKIIFYCNRLLILSITSYTFFMLKIPCMYYICCDFLVGLSYNPSLESHQELLQKAVKVEKLRQKKKKITKEVQTKHFPIVSCLTKPTEDSPCCIVSMATSEQHT